MDKTDWLVLSGIVGLIAMCFIMSYMVYSCENTMSMERLEQCEYPAFVQSVGTRHRVYYIYRCADGSLVKSSVLVKPES